MNEKTKLFDERAEEIFNKLIRLHRWDEQRRGALAAGAVPRLIPALIRLSRHESEFKSAMAALEERARRAAEAPPATLLPEGQVPPLASFSADEWQGVCDEVVRVKPLRAIFACEPRFSETEPRQLHVLAQLADVTPDENLQLSTQDGILTLMLQRNLPGADALLLEYLVKVLTLYLTDAPLTGRLAALADKPYWQLLLASLEDGMNYIEGSDAEASKALGDWTSGLSEQQRTDLQLKLGRPPRLSQTPPELVALAWARRDDLEETKKQATTQVVPAPSAAQPAGGAGIPHATALTDIRGWAVAVRDRLRAAGALGEVEGALRLRAELAEHLIEVRKIAKVETLRYRWPDAARLALQNRASIVEVEEHLLLLLTTPERAAFFTSDEARDLYTLSEQDRQFKRFLRLRPYFTDIPFFQYLSAAPLPAAGTTATAATTQGQQAATPVGAQTAPPPAETGAPSTHTPSDRSTLLPPADETRPPTPTPAAAQTPPAGYETFVFKIHAVSQQSLGAASFGYAAEIDFQNGKKVGAAPSLSPELIAELYASIGVAPDQDYRPFLSRMFARQDTEYLFRIVRAGQKLFRGVFGALWTIAEGERFSSVVVEALEDGAPMRVVVETNDLWVAESWPWEWLSFPDQRDLFIMSEQHSLVRAFPRRQPVLEKQLKPPLRVLIVVPNYSQSTLEDTRARALKLEALFHQQTMSQAPSQPPVKTLILSGEEVTEERLHNAIFDFIPHVLHFEGRVGGHQATEGSTDNLFLSLSTREGLAEQQLFLPRFEQMLNSAEVQLMVIEPGPFVTFIEPEALSFCMGLMAGALPAAVMPVREVEDGAVQEFLRGFYGALLDGLMLEAAVSKARLGLLGRGGDWTAFALFSDPETLDKSRIVPPPA